MPGGIDHDVDPALDPGAHRLEGNTGRVAALAVHEDVVVGRALYKHNARGRIIGDSDGLVKLVFDKTSRKLIGTNCIGDRATEIVHIGQAIMNQEGEANTLRYFINTTFNYPTMAEAYRRAALNGLNRIL